MYRIRYTTGFYDANSGNENQLRVACKQNIAIIISVYHKHMMWHAVTTVWGHKNTHRSWNEH